MITTDMRTYNIYGTTTDGYGSTKPNLTTPANSIKMAVYVTDYDAQSNMVFGSASYVGLTLDKRPDPTWVGGLVDINQKYLLKITYVYSRGRYTQIFMQETSYVAP